MVGLGMWWVAPDRVVEGTVFSGCVPVDVHTGTG
jgi:hypothetical protein